MKKTFNIGESTLGGILECELINDKFTVHCIDSITKEPVESGIFTIPKDLADLDVWLSCDVTTSYHADEILKHFKLLI
tara:strand:+ start:2980 stop:3213 length:234 start_codon:yes stop_codon:yes gene_type:complete